MEATCSWRPEDEAQLRVQSKKHSGSSIDGGHVVLLATTAAHAPFAANLLASLDREGVANAFVLTPDEAMLEECRRRNWPCGLGPDGPFDEVGLDEGSESSRSRPIPTAAMHTRQSSHGA